MEYDIHASHLMSVLKFSNISEYNSKYINILIRDLFNKFSIHTR